MRILARVVLTLALSWTVLLVPQISAQAADSRADKVMSSVAKQSGKPYKWGAAGPRSFDCSGLVQYSYKLAGKSIGRTSGQQMAGRRIPKTERKKGDILVFLRGSTAYHSAIYAGDGMMWEAQKSGTRVGKHKIWSTKYVVRRPA